MKTYHYSSKLIDFYFFAYEVTQYFFHCLISATEKNNLIREQIAANFVAGN